MKYYKVEFSSQCGVYTETLENVLVPTVDSVVRVGKIHGKVTSVAYLYDLDGSLTVLVRV